MEEKFKYNSSNLNSNPCFSENVLENHEIRKELTIEEIFKLSLNFGFISFGSRIEQINLIKEKLITKDKFMREKEFEYIYSLCKIFPGNTPCQVLFAISIIKTNSLLGGIISLIGFIFPSLLIMILISELIKRLKDYTYSTDKLNWDSEDDFFFYYLSSLITGICQGAIAILIENALILTKSLAKKYYDFTIIIICGILCYYSNNFGFIIIIMILGAILSTIQGDHDYFLDVSMDHLNLDEIKYLGSPAFFIMFLIYLFLFILRVIPKSLNINIYLMESFFRIGTFNFGGGSAIIPLILSEYSKLIEEIDILNAYAIKSLLPGPLFNISAFIGVMLSGILGGFISSIFIMLPGILYIMIALPYHSDLTKNQLIQNILRGASWATLGCLYVSAIRLIIDSCFNNYYTHFIYGLFNIFLCVIIQKIDIIPMKIISVLLFGGLFSLFCKVIELNI
jgi:chromate transporter